MSQSAQATAASPASQRTSERVRETGARLLDKLDGDRNVCSRCYARVRHPHEGVDAALARKAEGTLLKISATSSPDPAVFSEVVPPTSIESDPSEDPLGRTSRYRPARSKTICECGEIDHPVQTGPQSAEQRERAIENVAGRCDDDDRSFDLPAARAVLDAARDRRSLGGRHRDVFVMAVGFGLEHA